MGRWLELFRALKNSGIDGPTPRTPDATIDTFIAARRAQASQVSKLALVVSGVLPSIPQKNASGTTPRRSRHPADPNVIALARWILQECSTRSGMLRADVAAKFGLPGLRSVNRSRPPPRCWWRRGWLRVANHWVRRAVQGRLRRQPSAVGGRPMSRWLALFRELTNPVRLADSDTPPTRATRGRLARFQSTGMAPVTRRPHLQLRRQRPH